MIIIGYFGSIVFEVSPKKIKTFDSFNRSSQANFAQIERILNKPKLQFTGNALDKISFNVYLMKQLGVEPLEELEQMRELLKNGKEEVLRIGTRVIGRFVLTDISESWDIISNFGEVLAIGVSITLLEYSL